MNAFVPGLGHLYVARARRAIVCLAVVEVICLVLGQFGLFGSYLGFMLFYALHAAWLWLVYDSYRLAKKTPKPPLKWYMNRVYYALYAIAFLSASTFLAEYRSPIFGFDIVAMPDDSMTPAIAKDDLVLIDTKAYRHGDPAPGEAVLVRDSGNLTVRRVKSVDLDSVELVADDPNTLQANGSVNFSSLEGRASTVIFSVRFFWWM